MSVCVFLCVGIVPSVKWTPVRWCLLARDWKKARRNAKWLRHSLLQAVTGERLTFSALCALCWPHGYNSRQPNLRLVFFTLIVCHRPFSYWCKLQITSLTLVRCKYAVWCFYGGIVSCLGQNNRYQLSVFQRPFVKWFALCYRTVASLSCLCATLVYCGKTVG